MASIFTKDWREHAFTKKMWVNATKLANIWLAEVFESKER